MAFRFVFVLEAIVTKLALILFFRCMDPAGGMVSAQQKQGRVSTGSLTLIRPALRTSLVFSGNIHRCEHVPGCLVRWDVCGGRCAPRGISVRPRVSCQVCFAGVAARAIVVDSTSWTWRSRMANHGRCVVDPTKVRCRRGSDDRGTTCWSNCSPPRSHSMTRGSRCADRSMKRTTLIPAWMGTDSVGMGWRRGGDWRLGCGDTVRYLPPPQATALCPHARPLAVERTLDVSSRDENQPPTTWTRSSKMTMRPSPDCRVVSDLPVGVVPARPFPPWEIHTR